LTPCRRAWPEKARAYGSKKKALMSMTARFGSGDFRAFGSAAAIGRYFHGFA
jgi:hypothetical protein